MRWKTGAAQGKKTLPKSVAWVAADHIAPGIVRALLSFRPTEAWILRRQAAVLAYLKDNHRFRQAGLGAWSAFSVEYLKLSSSTTKARLDLDRTFRECPLAEEAFLAGRLTVCKVNALKLVLRGASKKDATKWINRAEVTGVRKLRRLVKEKTREAPESPAETMISFEAPPEVHLLFKTVEELGRMQLGHNGPRHEVIWAILAETGFGGAGGEPEEKEDKKPEPEPREVELLDNLRPPREAMARAVRTLQELEEHLGKFKRIAASESPRSVVDAIDQFHQLRCLEKPLRLFEARLLRDLRATRAVQVLGFRCVKDFLDCHLGLSERTARQMVADAELFEDVPSLAKGYLRNEVSLGKAHTLRWLTCGRVDKGFLRRAQELTHRQFYREARFLIHLRQCFPKLAIRFRGPLPQPGLEEALTKELRKEGVKDNDIEAELSKCRIEPIADGCSLDPAENPVVMRRLEALLDLLASTHWDEPPEVDEPLLRRDRQTLDHSRKPVYIRFRLPAEVAADWRAAIRIIRERFGLFLPEWKAAMILFAHCYEEWSLTDPEAVPTQKKILERDKYLCQAPACPKRCTCEAHHMHPRSQGGSNKPANLITLCHTDHQDEIHAGYAKVSGEAPQAIRWELGCRPGKEPLLKLRGERIVGGSRARLAADNGDQG